MIAQTGQCNNDGAGPDDKNVCILKNATLLISDTSMQKHQEFVPFVVSGDETSLEDTGSDISNTAVY